MTRLRGFRNDTGLKPSEEKFAALIAMGCSQREAYQKSYRAHGLTITVIDSRATRVAAKPLVIERAKSILRESQILDWYSKAEWFQDVIACFRAAKDDKNWTACANFTRQLGQSVGALTESNLTVNVTSNMTDEEVVKRLAGKDPDKAKMIQAIVGSADTYKTA